MSKSYKVIKLSRRDKDIKIDELKTVIEDKYYKNLEIDKLLNNDNDYYISAGQFLTELQNVLKNRHFGTRIKELPMGRIIPSDFAYIYFPVLYDEDSNAKKNRKYIKYTQELVSKLLKYKPKGIVIDVRNNPGGYIPIFLGSFYQVLGDSEVEFYKDSTIIRKIYLKNGEIEIIGIDLSPKDKKSHMYNSKIIIPKTEEYKEIKVVILINGKSASCSELLAYIVQNKKIGKVLGEKSGKALTALVGYQVDKNEFLMPIGRPKLEGKLIDHIIPDGDITKKYSKIF